MRTAMSAATQAAIAAAQPRTNLRCVKACRDLDRAPLLGGAEHGRRRLEDVQRQLAGREVWTLGMQRFDHLVQSVAACLLRASRPVRDGLPFVAPAAYAELAFELVRVGQRKLPLGSKHHQRAVVLVARLEADRDRGERPGDEAKGSSHV